MKKSSQKIKRNNNIQIGVNNAPIIQTVGNVTLKTEIKPDENKHITDKQALQIREKVAEIATMLASDGTEPKSLFPKEYKALYKKFGITSYKLLPKENFEEAMVWLQKRVASLGKKVLKKSNSEEWRKEQYKAINAKANQLGMDRETRLIYATKILKLNTPLASLKDLDDNQLQKLYEKMFSKK